MMMKDVKKMPADVEMYSKFYREFQESDFELDLIKIIRLVIKANYIALGNMMTAAALTGMTGCPIEGFHRKENFVARKIRCRYDKYGLSFDRFWIQKS
jgi:nitroreductase